LLLQELGAVWPTPTAPPPTHSLSAIAADIERLIGEKARAMQSVHGPCGPHPPPGPAQPQAALSSLVKSVSALQSTMPGIDIMQVVRAALEGQGSGVGAHDSHGMHGAKQQQLQRQSPSLHRHGSSSFMPLPPPPPPHLNMRNRRESLPVRPDGIVMRTQSP
jgi:hypothetical protein